MAEVVNNLGVFLGGSLTSGINLYLTIAGLGIAHRLGLVHLPGNLDVISGIPVIIVAIVLFAIEFCADKIPYVDSAWDSVHTFIRPVGGAALAYMAAAEADPAAQMSIALACGAISMDSHLTKASTRLAINTSPEPFSNSIASISEDAIVLVILWLIIRHPVIATVVAVLFLLFSVWFLKKMFRFVKRIFRFFGRSDTQEQGQETSS